MVSNLLDRIEVRAAFDNNHVVGGGNFLLHVCLGRIHLVLQFVYNPPALGPLD